MGAPSGRKAKQPITKRQIAAIHAFYAPAYGKTAPEIPKARAPSRDLEHPEQVKVIRWWRDNCYQFGYPEISLLAIPNANKRSTVGGDRLKKEGMRAGAADLFLAAPRGKWHGAFCEVKSSEGTLQINQSTFLYTMEMEGYRSECRYGHEAVIEFFTSYLRG